jgi:hypothetical protein
LIAPDVLLASQLERSKADENHVARIAVRTFMQALEDAQRGARWIDAGEDEVVRNKRNRDNHRRVIADYRDAIEWFNDDVKSGFSFLNLCEFLGLNEPMKIRARMNQYKRDLNDGIEWGNS